MANLRLRRGLAGGLAALMLLQILPTAALASEEPQWETAAVSAREEAVPQLQDGTAVIPAGSDAAAVKEILCAALISNYEDVDTSELEWEYFCEGKDTATGWATNEAWGSVNGFESETGKIIKVHYTHPALADNGDGSYRVRLAGTTEGVTLTKVEKLSSSIVLREGCTVALPYSDGGAVDYDALRAAIWDEVVADADPELTVDDVTIEYYATAPGSVGSLGKAWMPLEGGKESIYTYPAISRGGQKIRISYAGSETYSGTSAETTVTIAERPQAPYTLKAAPDPVTLVVDENLETDYDAIHDAIFAAVVESSEVLTADNVTIEYYATATTGAVGDLGKAWVSLEGGRVNALNYPGIPAGTQKIRISYAGDRTYAPTVIEAAVTVNDREQLQFHQNPGPYEVGMVFTADQGYDYEATAQAIYSAVVASTTPEIPFSEMTVEYNTDKTGLTHISYVPLSETDLTGLVKFGTGTWEIRISWPGNREYRDSSLTAEVTTTDSRLASAVALKAGASFTYNMDPAAMEQAIFDNVIDWDNSTLPARETLSPDNFTMEYYGEVTYLGSGVDVGSKDWAPIGGKDVSLGSLELARIPQLGAGENQQIRVRFNGSADYRPSEDTEGTVTVNKASVKVKVHSDNIYADEALPGDFITTDPADEFDRYVIFAGVTSNVTTALYLDLPDRYTDSGVIRLLDPIVEKIWGKSFTQMLNDGVTVGELRELLSTQELLDLLDTLNIDTGTFGQILSAVNNMPGILDSVRVAFGVPNRAGLYTVAAVTDNRNYETGLGMGFLLVKMRLSGVQLTWNQELGSKISAADAQDFDFGATLSYNGDVTISQENVHYLYSGFTSKWRVYSSTTTPPTEPGRYVVTVVTLGGNYQAAPITRSFQITK